MHIKNILRHHFLTLRLVKIYKFGHTFCGWGCGKQVLLGFAGGNANGDSLCRRWRGSADKIPETAMADLSKIRVPFSQ